MKNNNDGVKKLSPSSVINKDSEIAHLPENLIYQSQLIMPLALWLDSILPPMQQQCGDPLNHRLEID